MPRKPAVPGVDRRQQILDAALEIFAEQGFEATTNKAIAERAGVNQGLIYFYFSSKADVYFATSAYHSGLAMAEIDAVFALEEIADPVENLIRLFRQIVLVTSTPMVMRLMRLAFQASGSREPSGALSDATGRRASGGFARHLTQHFQTYLETHVAQGEFAALNPRLVAQIMTRTLITMATSFAVSDSQPEQESSNRHAAIDAMARLYCYGLLPRQE